MASKRDKKKWARHQREMTKKNARERENRNAKEQLVQSARDLEEREELRRAEPKAAHKPLSEIEMEELRVLIGRWSVKQELDRQSLNAAERLAILLNRIGESFELLESSFLESCDSSRHKLEYMRELRGHLISAPISYEKVTDQLLDGYRNFNRDNLIIELILAVKSDILSYDILSSNGFGKRTSNRWHCFSIDDDESDVADLARELDASLRAFLAAWQRVPSDAPQKLAVPPSIRVGLAQICDQVAGEMRTGVLNRSTLMLLKKSMSKVALMVGAPVTVVVAAEGINNVLYPTEPDTIVIAEQSENAAYLANKIFDRIEELHGSSIERENKIDFGINLQD